MNNTERLKMIVEMKSLLKTINEAENRLVDFLNENFERYLAEKVNRMTINYCFQVVLEHLKSELADEIISSEMSKK